MLESLKISIILSTNAVPVSLKISNPIIVSAIKNTPLKRNVSTLGSGLFSSNPLMNGYKPNKNINGKENHMPKKAVISSSEAT
jgi:hypothetical protein